MRIKSGLATRCEHGHRTFFAFNIGGSFHAAMVSVVIGVRGTFDCRGVAIGLGAEEATPTGFGVPRGWVTGAVRSLEGGAGLG